MDRFEEGKALTIRYIMIIYIPVWIDLKYLDLQYLAPFNLNLHSSMDRFEASDRVLYKPHLVYLHSSMDRFEEE